MTLNNLSKLILAERGCSRTHAYRLARAILGELKKPWPGEAAEAVLERCGRKIRLQ